jgi:stage II sporulation protein GA (sporulation sigma-E factor processing peptidase)
MKTLYLDELFLLNLVINYFLLLATAKVCALPYRRARFLLSGAVGGLWCCLALLSGFSFLQAPLMELVLAMIMTLCAFGQQPHLFRCFFSFLGISALFGGAVYAIELTVAPYMPQGLLVQLDMRTLALSFALCWALVSLVFRHSAKNARQKIWSVTMEHQGRTVQFRAMEDTGNGLYDPLSGCAVLVAEMAAIAPLFTTEQSVWLSADPVDAVSHVPGLRLIPYGDVSGERRFLAAFRPQMISVDGHIRTDLMVAAAPAPLDGQGSYQAIL